MKDLLISVDELIKNSKPINRVVKEKNNKIENKSKDKE